MPVISVRSSGEPIADYSRELTDSERSIAEDIIARHEPEDITFNEQMYISDEYKKYLESMYKYMEMQ
ncbi:MAG: hypothetical protein HPY87_08860 [Fervidobacterium sp.]|uniref:hypothetical protein n=1 Tax=Fervidobacterium sp. TaxID=1871331 RepID=UPI0025BA4775|nr:hypothetical protein [Fervidobacterium sp.]NPU89970.1 hypothetical protein [Fervidobacterium sp.]